MLKLASCFNELRREYSNSSSESFERQHALAYTQSGNGYIEGRELDNFLREFVTSIRDDKVSFFFRTDLFQQPPVNSVGIRLNSTGLAQFHVRARTLFIT